MFSREFASSDRGGGISAAKRAECLRCIGGVVTALYQRGGGTGGGQQFSILSHAPGCVGLMSMIMISIGILPVTVFDH